MSDADRYFAMDPRVAEGATGGAYFEVDKDVPPVELVPGLVFRPVVGSQLMASFVRFGPNTEAPVHTHEEEQILVVIEGELEFDLAGDLRTMRPGMAVVIPPGVPHGARTRDTPCFEIDIFHPPRRALLELTQGPGERSAEAEAPSTPLPAQAAAGAMELGLRGKKAIVTGGTKGLGLAIAEVLAREGADVAICARQQEELTAAAGELRSGGATVYSQPCDVTDPGQVTDFIARSAEALGGVDILVNNAGAARPGDFDTLSDEDWQADLDVKLFSMIRCSRAVVPHMRARGGGRIININAVYGRYPDPTFFATSVNRAACLSFTKTLAIQLAPENILVNSVNPGFVVTPQWKRIHRRRAPDISEEEFFRRMASEEVPLGRFGRPDEVASLVVFLASDRASYITGASVDVAGGMGKYV